MSRFLSVAAASLLVTAGMLSAQSPATTASAVIAGKNITIKYAAPSVRGRKIFGDGGLLSHDVNYPVWRAGANSATAFHTDADLTLGNVAVPKGDYTLYVLVKDPDAWELIVNKATGQWGLTYDASTDLGRVKMTMKKPAGPVETLKYTISDLGGNKGMLQLEWENHVASVPLTLK